MTKKINFPNKLSGLIKNKYFLILAAVCIALVVIFGISSFAGTSKYSNKVVTRFSTSDKVVALTFDDGPFGTDKKGATKSIVDILAKNNVSATFFMVGKRAEKAPSAVQYTIAKGNEVALHSYSHKVMKSYSASECRAELAKSDSAIRKISGLSPVWFRAPQGKISSTCLNEIYKKGYYYANWTGTTIDTNADDSADVIAGRVVSSAKPGAIILLHETNPNTIKALPTIIKKLKAKGYKIETMTKIMADTTERKTASIKTLPKTVLTVSSPLPGAPVNFSVETYKVSSTQNFVKIRVFITDANRKEVGDTQWVNSKARKSYSAKISNIAISKLPPGKYNIGAELVMADGQRVSTKVVTFIVAPEPGKV
jgi:peptidoglycan/xylan/chitin deacetylase (PgdA/CDA1 family)